MSEATTIMAMPEEVIEGEDTEPNATIENIKPKADRVFIKPLTPHTKTKGGILVAGSSQAPKKYGRVVAVGPGRRTEKGDLVPMSTQVGDTVLLGQYPGQEFKIGSVEYVMLHDGEIVAGVE